MSIVIWKTNTHPVLPFVFVSLCLQLMCTEWIWMNPTIHSQFLVIFIEPYVTRVLGLFSRARWKHSCSPSRGGIPCTVGIQMLSVAGLQNLRGRQSHQSQTPRPQSEPQGTFLPHENPLVQVSKIILGFRCLHLLDFPDFRCYSEYLRTPRSLLKR